MLTLLYTIGGRALRYTLGPGDTLMGRAPTCAVILDHPSVSRWHARLAVADGRCTLEDLGSANGTFRNGEPVRTTEVVNGDRLLLGQVAVEVEEQVERISLSDHHILLDSPKTLYRRMSDGSSVRIPGAAALAEPAPSTVAPRLLGMLSAIARSLVNADALPAVLNRVADLLFQSIPAERGVLLTTDEATGELVARLARTRDGRSLTGSNISRTVAQLVLQEKVAVLTADVAVDDRLNAAESLMAQNVRSVMCAPLWADEQVIGILYADSPAKESFSSDDLDLFTALSNYAAVAIQRARMAARVQEEQRRRERLERYHSPAVVKRIFQDPEQDAFFIAQERQITVVFADIVGFTGIAERLAPSRVAKLLNTYFSRMADIIFDHEGTLDKFVGDAVMAVFGAPLEQPDHAARAVRTVLAMRSALEELNDQRLEIPLEARYAVNSGLATVGDIGSIRRREFTVLGDVVNLASRLESTVAEPGQVVVGPATHAEIQHLYRTRYLRSVVLRGRNQSVDVFAVEA
jgi:adenylate cyclase